MANHIARAPIAPGPIALQPMLTPTEDDEDLTESQLYVAMLPENADIALTGRAFTMENVQSRPDVDYEQMTAVEIRKLCTQRGIRVPSNTRKAERIQRLRDYDSASPGLIDALGRGSQTTTAAARRSRHCMFRLLNVLFSDEFIDSFASTGTFLFD